MERVAEIGIYEYINEKFPDLSKDDKVLYFSIFMKRTQFMCAHIEWLYNNPNAFIGWQMIRAKQNPDGADRKFLEQCIKLNDELDETYMISKYSTQPGICRGRSEYCTIEEWIETGGLYAYIDCFCGPTTGNKLITYYVMIQNPVYFEAHCKALRQDPYKDPNPGLFPPVEDVGHLL